MNDYEIRENYNLFKGYIPYSKAELKKFNKLLYQYIENEKTHLYVNDDRNCKYLIDSDMRKKYDNYEYFESGMFKSDKEWNDYQNNDNLDIHDVVDYKNFCIYNEIKALTYFGKDINEIIKIIHKKY